MSRNHEVLSLTGGEGEGWVFDTNALHRADLDGNMTRHRVLVLEFHAHGKVPRLLQAGHNGPCPSRKDGIYTRTASTQGQGCRGLRRFALYPPEPGPVKPVPSPVLTRCRSQHRLTHRRTERGRETHA